MSFDIGQVLLAAIAFVVWLVRLEGKSNHNKEEIESLKGEIKTLNTKHEALDSKMIHQLMEVKESLARIEGALGVKKHD